MSSRSSRGNADGLAAEIEPLTDGFRIGSRILEVTVRRGAIVRVVNKVTGEIHADGDPDSPYMPRGLISPTGNADDFRTLHGAWSSHQIDGQGRFGPTDATARRPASWSATTCASVGNGVRFQWTGLESARGRFAEDTLAVEAVVDPDSGFIDITASATSPTQDVAGVMVPILNLHARHALYVPSFGGLVYTPDDLRLARLRTLRAAPYLEAPVLVAEGARGCLGLWIEDPTFRPYGAFFGGNGDGFAMGLEAVGLMPFEGCRASRRATWRIGAFGGTWPAAMTPYRDWYARNFSSEIARRRAFGWPERISVIVDAVEKPAELLPRLRTTFDPSRVLLHEWQSRKAPFDAQLPDWTPSSDFVSLVRLAHGLGFRAMGYVNTFCVNSGAPVMQRDGIAEFALTRRIPSLSDYGSPVRTFANARPDEILYLDPLAPRWRRYHTDRMIEWRTMTKADANYEDTGGTAGDFGNGEIDGLSGAEGGTAQFRQLLERNPVPMATEYAPDNMAFASQWALRYSQVWGDAEIRRLWESRHRPITPLLFSGGGRAWVPSVAAETEALKWTALACADALGAVAQLSATSATLDATAGPAHHMLDRAKVFERLELRPAFEDWPRDAAVVAQYRSRDGELFRYRVDDGLQELVDAEGSPIYQRVTNRTSVESPLRIRGWPAWNGGRTIGLRPESRYALTTPDARGTVIRIDRCPAGASISAYRENPEYVLVNFTSDGSAPASEGEALRVVAFTDFIDAIWCGRDGEPVRRGKPLRAGESLEFDAGTPRDLLLLRSLPLDARVNWPLGSIAAGGIFMTADSGIERGGRAVPVHAKELTPPGASRAVRFFLSGQGGDSVCVYERLVGVPDASSSLLLMFRNSQDRFGDGATVHVSVNGRRVKSIDLGPNRESVRDGSLNTDLHRWRVPLGRFSGLPTVIGVEVTNNGTDNADEIWIAEPMIIKDASQAMEVRSTPMPGR